MRPWTALSALPFLALPALGCTLGGGSVTRVYWGKTVEGRFIAPEAYAHYAQAVLHETQGDDPLAAEEYVAALDIDSESNDAWTRLGAVRCRLRDKSADDAFEVAESLDKTFAPLWRERARCALSRGDARRAAELARRAIELDPSDERASLALAEAEHKLGRKAEAERWLRALVTRDPSARAAAAELASLRGAKPRPPASTGKRARARPTPELVDRALIQGTESDAHALALSQGMTLGTLALRAAALGRTGVALSQSEGVLEADPDDSDAWIAGLWAATLVGDSKTFDRISTALGPHPTEPSPLGARLLGALIERRLGAEAGEAWRRAAGPLPPPADELEKKLDARASE